MYTIVYVVVDNEKLLFYNQMMKSLTSLRMHMPEQNVCVLTESKTYSILKQNNAEIFDMAEVISVPVGDDYSEVEKSRYIKLTLRERVSGDILYIDTDTVICESFPEKVSDKSVGMVLEFNSLRTDLNWYLTDKYDQLSGLDLENFDYFFNSGVIWSRDDEHAHRIYRKWYELWEVTHKRETPRDQSPLNYIIREEMEYVDVLDGVWNCQIAGAFGIGLNYLADAYIIHYFNMYTNPYLLGQPEYRDKSYKDECIVSMLRNPRSQFGKCRVVKLDSANQINLYTLEQVWAPSQTFLFKYFMWMYRHKKIFRINEIMLESIYSVKKGICKLFRKE